MPGTPCGALRGEALVGVMPLMSLDGEPGTVLSSLPYCGSPGGPLADDLEACDALCTWYAEQAQAQNVVAATVVANPLTAHAASVVHDVVDVRIAHVTPLDDDGDADERIWAAIDGSARRNVAKAKRCGTEVAVENGGLADLEHLHRRSMAVILLRAMSNAARRGRGRWNWGGSWPATRAFSASRPSGAAWRASITTRPSSTSPACCARTRRTSSRPSPGST